MIIMVNLSLSNCSQYSLGDYRDVAWILVGVNISTSLVGILGNFLVCIALFTTRDMTSSFHYFISSLAAADLTIALVDQPLLVVLIIGRISSKCFSVLFIAYCLVGNFGCAVSGLTLALIAIDRCLFVVTKCNYKNTMTLGKKIVLAIVWGLACVYSAIRVIIDTEITAPLTTAALGLCYIEMIVCYAVIYHQVFKQRNILANSRLHNTRSNVGDEIRAQKENDITGRRFTCTIVMVLVVFFARSFLIFYLGLTQPEKEYGITYNTARTVALSASAINPALYCFRNREYRQAFKRVLLRFSLGAPAMLMLRKQYERIK